MGLEEINIEEPSPEPLVNVTVTWYDRNGKRIDDMTVPAPSRAAYFTVGYTLHHEVSRGPLP